MCVNLHTLDTARPDTPCQTVHRPQPAPRPSGRHRSGQPARAGFGLVRNQALLVARPRVGQTIRGHLDDDLTDALASDTQRMIPLPDGLWRSDPAAAPTTKATTEAADETADVRGDRRGDVPPVATWPTRRPLQPPSPEVLSRVLARLKQL